MALWCSPLGLSPPVDVGDAIFLHPHLTTAATAYTRIYVNVATPGVGTWAIRVLRYNASTDA